MPTATGKVWTRLRCSRRRYVGEHPGPVTVGDLDGESPACPLSSAAVVTSR